MHRQWDIETDVAVVGYGFAGGVAAISAHDNGSSVLLMEKMQYPGGISIASAGGVAITDNFAEAFAYLRQTCGGRTPDPILKEFALGLLNLPSMISRLAEAVNMDVDMKDQHRGGTYPLAGASAVGSLKINPIEGFQGFPWAPQGLRGGARLFKIIYENVKLRPKITVKCGMVGRKLIKNGNQEIIGLTAEYERKPISIRAKRGIVLATGGFEFDQEYKMQHFQAIPVYGVTSQGNTGDGIRMAQVAGAGLWHMWMYHGGYGFKFPEYPVAFRNRFLGFRNPNDPMPWIVVDRYGRRFMNEYHPAPQDTGCRALDLYDPERQEFPRIPCYLVFDEDGRRTGPLAIPIFTLEQDKYKWSCDNNIEVERGWIKKANTIDELAGLLNSDGYGHMEEKILTATISRWNQMAKNKEDTDFGRLSGNIVPIRRPPFYGIPAWPVVSNTQGGPVRDEHQRILNAFGEPIDRLFSAGELGSLFGHLYMEGGNVAECFVGGWRAGQEVSKLPKWE